jgi:hypothetical protein
MPSPPAVAVAVGLSRHPFQLIKTVISFQWSRRRVYGLTATRGAGLDACACALILCRGHPGRGPVPGIT